MQRKILTTWLLFSLLVLAGLGYLLFIADAQDSLLIGKTTHGHHQIEMACEACHTDAFGGPEVLQDACVACHQEELENSHDSHPRKKFTDPRNAELALKLDAKQCVTCHLEHELEQTRSMGVTVPDDVCYHCHEKVGEHRESHEGLEFDTCATSGCHNFHDNRALYESFLVKNSGHPWVNYEAVMPKANTAKLLAKKGASGNKLKPAMQEHPQITEQWAASGHAESNVGCVDCHEAGQQGWEDKPENAMCGTCHEAEQAGFVGGKHGMRLSAKLPKQLGPMSPELGRLPFDHESLSLELSCNSCHDPHKPDLVIAAVESCLDCHADQHSLAYQGSPHARLWAAEVSGHAAENSGVTCATCHMPSEQHKQFIDKEAGLKKVSIQHNQNMTLRPNEKMIRPVCMQCHSLEFSIDALADEALILNNFNGKPSKHVESVDWALKRENR